MSPGAAAHVGIMGAGSIGCYVGGSLAAHGHRVTLIGRDSLVEAVAQDALTVEDTDGVSRRVEASAVHVDTAAEPLASCDAVFVCTKSGQSAEVGRTLAPLLREDALVVSMQNGLRNAEVLREALPGRTVLPSIVGFNVVRVAPSSFKRTTSGALWLQRFDSESWRPVVKALSECGLRVRELDDLRAKQCTKLLINLNNAVSALSGAPTMVLVSNGGYRRLMADLVEEALRVLLAAGEKPGPLGPLPMAWVPTLLRAPDWMVSAMASTQTVDPEARSSMWEDLERRRPTEVDHLNGDIVRLAGQHQVPAPLNVRIVELVKEVAEQKAGSPGWSPSELHKRLRAGERDAD